jgi:radical SAM protein with 4Fe4S-binding SPASM domain
MDTLWWEATRQCNLHCATCSNDSGQPLPDELTDTEVATILSDAVNIGVKRLKVYGGEPFLREDLASLIRYSTRIGLKSTFYTNGTLLNDRTLSIIRSAVQPRVCISVDSADPMVHDNMRGGIGVLHQVLSAAKRLIAESIPVEFFTTVSKLNISEVDGVFELAHSIGVGSVKINPISRAGRAEAVWQEYGLDSHDYATLATAVRRAQQFSGARPGRKPCGAGVTEVYVASNGMVFPCPLLVADRWRGGNLRIVTLRDILAAPEPGFAEMAAVVSGQEHCPTCTKRDMCGGGCRARATRLSACANGADPFACSTCGRSCD